MSSPIAIKPLYTKLDECLSVDKFRLKRRITQLSQKLNSKADGRSAASEKKNEKKGEIKGEIKSQNANGSDTKEGVQSAKDNVSAQFKKLAQDIEASIAKRAWRKDNLPDVEYPPLLGKRQKRRH